MGRIKNITLPDNTTYDIYGKNVQNITWSDYQNLTSEQKNSDTAYFITDVPEEEMNKGIVAPIPNTPTEIATFTANELLMPSLKIGIEPVQSGSGNPSPTNIRPISGHTEANVVISPLNISQIYNGQIYGDGNWASNNARLTNVLRTQDNSYFLKAGTYTLDYEKLNSNAPNLVQCSALTKDDNYTIIDNFANAWYALPFTFTLTQDGYLYFTIRRNASINLNPSDYKVKILGQTTPIQFTVNGEIKTIYSGYVEIVNGKVKAVATDENIASYNGETLPSTWISDRDVYAEGTTPTIGAQVVYKLATPIEYDLADVSISTLDGTNNLSADSGKILDGTYYINPSTQLRMNDQILTNDTWRPIKLDGVSLISDSTTSLDIIPGSNVTIEGGIGSNLGKITISATDTTYESKAAASGGTAVSLVTTGEKYEWNNADTTVDQKLESTSTSSYPLLMSSDTYADTSVHYTGDVLRNNNIYANPSSGAITAIGWVNSGNGTANNAKLVRAWNENGYAGVMAGSSGAQTESLLGLMVKGVNDSEGNYLIWRAALGTSALLTTPATYIGGYNYNNQWENFIVQGRSGHFWGTIPAVTSNNGILEIGKHIDFHTTSGSTADNDYRISCTGSGAATYSGTWTKSSSIKIKENIEDMDLDEAKNIFKLRPVKFDYKKGFGQKDQRGLIAEEVAEVLPKLVVAEVGEEGTEEWCPASVDYIGVVPYLIKIVQEQQKEIDELKAKVG